MITSVRRRRTFAELQRDGRRVRHGSVRLSYLPLDVPEPQVAFALGRSFGTAVERNRGRRRLRSAFAEAWTADARSGRDRLDGAFLLAGNRGLLTDAFPQLVADIGRCFDKLRRRP